MAFARRTNRNRFQERKILWINPLTLDAGLHKADFLDILTALAERGYRNCLIAIRSRKIFRFDENSRIRIISIPLGNVPVFSRVMFAITLFFLLPIYIISFKPDFIILQPDMSILSLIPELLFYRLKKVKFILDIRSTPVETGGFRGFLQKFWFAPSILVAKKLFNGITIITPLMKREVCESFHINPNKLGVWTSGVSTALFNPRNYISESIELKRKLGLSGKFVVFYHGVFTASRGLTETIKAMKILRDASHHIVFFLLGTGPIVPMLEDLIHTEELQGKVVIHNPVNHREVPKFISMSDVCIVPLPDHPYWRFQCPLKLLEYLAMKKVVIVTDIPAHRSVIGNEKCGIYISSIKPAEIAESIIYAYQNREKLGDWGATGRIIVDEKYSWKRVAENLENYLCCVKD